MTHLVKVVNQFVNVLEPRVSVHVRKVGPHSQHDVVRAKLRRLLQVVFYQSVQALLQIVTF